MVLCLQGVTENDESSFCLNFENSQETVGKGIRKACKKERVLYFWENTLLKLKKKKGPFCFKDLHLLKGKLRKNSYL